MQGKYIYTSITLQVYHVGLMYTTRQDSTSTILPITMVVSTRASIHTEVSDPRLSHEVPKSLLHNATGVHALGDRARKLDQGILITRFELPFNIWWYALEHISSYTYITSTQRDM